MQGPREVIRQFQCSPDVRVFLLTRGQGAAGLTLTQGALHLHHRIMMVYSLHATCFSKHIAESLQLDLLTHGDNAGKVPGKLEIQGTKLSVLSAGALRGQRLRCSSVFPNMAISEGIHGKREVICTSC